jgi:hypothetical protein
VEPVPGAPPSTGWRRHQAPSEAFAAELPGTPLRDGSEDGASVSWQLMAPAPAPSFGVVVYRLPDADRAASGVTMLEDALVSRAPGASRRGAVTVGKALPARAILLEDGRLRSQIRVLAVGRRLYQLTIIADGSEPDPADVQRFFGSFEAVAGPEGESGGKSAAGR